MPCKLYSTFQLRSFLEAEKWWNLENRCENALLEKEILPGEVRRLADLVVGRRNEKPNRTRDEPSVSGKGIARLVIARCTKRVLPVVKIPDDDDEACARNCLSNSVCLLR